MECQYDDGLFRSPASAAQQHREAASKQRRMLLLPLLVALGLFTVSSTFSKFLAPRGVGGRPNDSDIRLSARAPSPDAPRDAPIDGAPVAKEEDETDRNDSDDCTAGADFAMQGVDLVAYFSLAHGDEPVLGSTTHVSTFGSYSFLFSSANNLALFEEDPLTYLPAWGGFCGYGISEEDYWSATELGPPVDINSWAITSYGKLCFFRSETAKYLFLRDEDAYIEAGDANWTDWFGEDPTTYPFDASCFCTLDTC
eukprot:g15708.t1